MTIPLTEKKCEPCEGKVKAMDIRQANEYLKNTPGWKLDENNQSIYREFMAKNFMTAINFMNKVAQIAENENHHPDFHLTDYRHLKIYLSTHAIGGLSENDFIVAAKINQLPIELKKQS